MQRNKRWPIIRRKKKQPEKGQTPNPVKAIAKPIVPYIHAPAPKVIQPKGAYGRFMFEVTFIKKDKSRDVVPMFAYSDEMAQKQAANLLIIFRHIHDSVKSIRKVARVDLTFETEKKCNKRPEWADTFLREWKKCGKDKNNFKE